MKIQEHNSPSGSRQFVWVKNSSAGLRITLAVLLTTAAIAQEVIITEEAGVRTVMTTFEGGGHFQSIAADTDHRIPGAGMWFQGSAWVNSVRPPGTFLNNPSGTVIATWMTAVNSQFVQFAEPVFEVFLHYSGSQTVRLDAIDANGIIIATTGLEGTPTGDEFSVWRRLSVTVPGNRIARLRVFGGGIGRTMVDDVGYRRYLPIEVPIDVKPGNENEIDPINLKAKGSLALAVFSTPDLDATLLDVCSLMLGDPNLIQIATVVFGHTEDLNGDGSLDAILHFSASELVDGGAINSTTTELLLTGSTTDGKSVFGTDPVRIVGGGK